MAQAKTEDHDAVDVERALKKTNTADGSGFENENELPESDFVSFAEDDVEVNEGEGSK